MYTLRVHTHVVGQHNNANNYVVICSVSFFSSHSSFPPSNCNHIKYTDVKLIKKKKILPFKYFIVLVHIRFNSLESGEKDYARPGGERI